MSFLTFASASKDVVFKVIPSESSVKWTGKKVTGEHTGNVAVKEGTLTFGSMELKGGSFVIDMKSITCTDLTDKEWNKKLVDHLNSDDFFSVSKHPTAKLEIKDAMFAKGGGLDITASLTIKGKTQQVIFPAKLDVSNGKVTATGKIKFNRTKFDIKYKSGSFFQNLGDKMIYDDVELEVKVVAKK